jgi:hypothetical protein
MERLLILLVCKGDTIQATYFLIILPGRGNPWKIVNFATMGQHLMMALN